jgi:hypothetical protein
MTLLLMSINPATMLPYYLKRYKFTASFECRKMPGEVAQEGQRIDGWHKWVSDWVLKSLKLFIIATLTVRLKPREYILMIRNTPTSSLWLMKLCLMTPSLFHTTPP